MHLYGASGGHGKWTNPDALANLEASRLSVFQYTETFYNPARRHQTLGYCRPDRFETEYAPHWLRRNGPRYPSILGHRKVRSECPIAIWNTAEPATADSLRPEPSE